VFVGNDGVGRWDVWGLEQVPGAGIIWHPMPSSSSSSSNEDDDIPSDWYKKYNGVPKKEDFQNLPKSVRKRMCCAWKNTAEDSKHRERRGLLYASNSGSFAQFPEKGAWISHPTKTVKYKAGVQLVGTTQWPEGANTYPYALGSWTPTRKYLALDWHTHPVDDYPGNKPYPPSKPDTDVASDSFHKKARTVVLSEKKLFAYDLQAKKWKILGDVSDVLDCKEFCCKEGK